MENIKIVTSGNSYIDIDAYAGCIAYANLLNLCGIPAKAISSAKLNQSIPSTLLNLNTSLDSHIFSGSEEFILIDISDKKYFDRIVKEDNIIGIIDHHTGFEDYWKKRLGKKSQIEFIGSVCTIIFELYEKYNLCEKITQDIAYLLVAAILDNTLNLKAKITSNRDITAYNKIVNLYKITDSFKKEYFLECQKTIEDNLKLSLLDDSKFEKHDGLPNVFAQLMVYNKDNIVKQKDLIYKVLNFLDRDNALNLISLEDNRSYILSNNIETQRKFEKIFQKTFNNNLMDLGDLWLRKEIIKKAQQGK